MRTENVKVVNCGCRKNGNEITMEISFGEELNLYERCVIRKVLLSGSATTLEGKQSVVVAKCGSEAFLIKPKGCTAEELVNFFAEAENEEASFQSTDSKFTLRRIVSIEAMAQEAHELMLMIA